MRAEFNLPGRRRRQETLALGLARGLFLEIERGPNKTTRRKPMTNYDKLLATNDVEIGQILAIRCDGIGSRVRAQNGAAGGLINRPCLYPISI